MPRENAAEKAARYLVEGRLVVHQVDPGQVAATCRGDGTVWRQQWTPDAGWSCTCQRSPHARCAHLIALGRVVAVDLTAHHPTTRSPLTCPAPPARPAAAAPNASEPPAENAAPSGGPSRE